MPQLFNLPCQKRNGNFYDIPFPMIFDTSYMDEMTAGWLIPNFDLNRVHIPNFEDSFVQSDTKPQPNAIHGIIFRYILNDDPTWYFSPVDTTLFFDALQSNAYNQYVDFNVYTASTPSPPDPPPPLTSKISLTTTGEKAIDKTIWGCSAERNWQSGANATAAWVDILDPQYEASVAGLNFTFLYYSGGAPSGWDEVIIGNTALSGSNPSTDGNGFNCASAGCAVIDGLCCGVFGHDAFNNTVQLCVDLGIDLYLVANIQLGVLADLTTWRDQLEWKIQHCINNGITIRAVAFGQENDIPGHDNVWKGDGTVQFPLFTPSQLAHGDGAINMVTKVLDGITDTRATLPAAKIHIDSAPIGKVLNNNARYVGWNDNIRIQTNDYDGDRQYFNHQQMYWNLNTNFQHNLEQVLEADFQRMPYQWDQIRAQNPGKVSGAWQWGLQDFEVTPIHGTFLGLLHLTWLGTQFLNYNYLYDLFDIVAYESLKNLVKKDGSTTAHYNAMEKLGIIFTGTPILIPITIDTTESAIYGFGWRDNNSNTYRVILTNYSDTEKLYSSIPVDHVEPLSYSRETVRATSLDATHFIDDSENSDMVVVPAFSINLYELNF